MNWSVQRTSPVRIVWNSARCLAFEPLQAVFEPLYAPGNRPALRLIGVVEPSRDVAAKILHRIAIVLQLQSLLADRDLGPVGIDRAAQGIDLRPQSRAIDVLRTSRSERRESEQGR